MYSWIKALHIVFVTSWFAGLFYLPRIFVNLAMIENAGAERDRLLLMARKLYRFMTPLGILALGFGLWLWMGFDLPLQGWLLAKLAIVVALVVYHLYCGMLLDAFAEGRNQRSHRWFRWFNELPVVLLLGAVILVVVKPF
jgi:protoporphyrinogen IX oxidase